MRLFRKFSTLRHKHRSGRNYADRVIKKLATGAMHSTLGRHVKDEAYTRKKALKWLGFLKNCDLRSDMLCVEYGCGSLWAAEPVIEFLQPGKFIGLDVVDNFYKMGLERISELAAAKKPRLATISQETLQRIAAELPEFIYSRKVLSHIAPTDRCEFFAKLCSILAPGAVCVLDSVSEDSTFERNRGTWAHSIDDIRRDLPAGIRAAVVDHQCILRRTV